MPCWGRSIRSTAYTTSTTCRTAINGSLNPISTTIASENARILTTFSGMVMLPDVPEEYLKKADMFEFIQEMPTTWDDTRILHGSIPNYITTARRSGDAWFVCSVTNESARTLGIDLDFLDANVTYDVTYYEDDHDGIVPDPLRQQSRDLSGPFRVGNRQRQRRCHHGRRRRSLHVDSAAGAGGGRNADRGQPLMGRS